MLIAGLSKTDLYIKGLGKVVILVKHLEGLKGRASAPSEKLAGSDSLLLTRLADNVHAGIKGHGRRHFSKGGCYKKRVVIFNFTFTNLLVGSKHRAIYTERVLHLLCSVTGSLSIPLHRVTQVSAIKENG